MTFMCAITVITLLPVVKATRDLWSHAANPAALVPAIKATIGAAMMHGVLLALGLAASRLL
jgi:1,4-dihydroxy-2-naphthoate octaprenyltransferase